HSDCGVAGNVRARPETRESDDRSATLAHHLRGPLGADEKGRDVTINRVAPALRPQSRYGPERRDVDRVVHVDVENAPLGRHAIEHCRELLEVADVRTYGQSAAPTSAELLDNLLRIVLAGHIIDDYVGPAFAEREGDGSSDAARAAGDERDAACQRL